MNGGKCFRPKSTELLVGAAAAFPAGVEWTVPIQPKNACHDMMLCKWDTKIGTADVREGSFDPTT